MQRNRTQVFRSVALVGVVLLLATSTVGCQRGRAGARCRTTDWGDDGGAWVMQCRKGRWVRVLTKSDAARILISLQATTTTTAPPVTVPTTTAPPRVGATRATALPRASQFLQGSFYLVINSTSPTAIPELVGATPTGFSFVGIQVTLVCSGATETPCNNAITQRFEQTFVMTDAAGNEYPRSTYPAFDDDLVNTPRIDSNVNGTVTFRVPTDQIADMVVKSTTSRTSTRNPTYVRIAP